MASQVSLSNIYSSSFYGWEDDADGSDSVNEENGAPVQVAVPNSNLAGNNPALINGMAGNQIANNGMQAPGCNAAVIKDIAKAGSQVVIDLTASSAKMMVKGTVLPIIAAPFETVKPLAAMCGAEQQINACQVTVTQTVTTAIDSTVDSSANFAKAGINGAIDTVVDDCAQPDSCISQTSSFLSC